LQLAHHSEILVIITLFFSATPTESNDVFRCEILSELYLHPSKVVKVIDKVHFGIPRLQSTLLSYHVSFIEDKNFKTREVSHSLVIDSKLII